MSEQDSLKISVEKGLIEGEVLFRNSLAKMAVRGSGKVNTKLLLTLAADVYDIRENDEGKDKETSAEEFAHEIREASLAIEGAFMAPEEEEGETAEERLARMKREFEE